MSIEPVRINWTISIGFVSAVRKGTFEIDREEWDSLTPTERTKYIAEMYDQKVSEYIDGGWQVANADVNDPTGEG